MVLTGREKATILLSLLGADLSAQILRSLPPDMADLIASGINNLPNPSSDVISSVLEEFASFIALPDASQKRGIEQQASARSTQAPPKANRSPYDTLFYSKPKKVAMALSAERSSVTAFVMSMLPAVQARDVLAFMPDRKNEIEDIMRDLRQTPMSEKVKEDVIAILAERIERMYSEG
ncbi:MAG: hypothetical protein NTZ10_07335 [Candidatus Saganbacteria bacterium]|nr:hypothetical protein [Candidatus Saganbacteria bacterium]